MTTPSQAGPQSATDGTFRRAAIVVRGPVESQQRQVDRCTAYAERLGYTTDQVIVRLDDNIDAQHIIAGDRDFDTLLVTDYSRLGRNMGQVMDAVAQLERAGIKVVTMSMDPAHTQALQDIIVAWQSGADAQSRRDADLPAERKIELINEYAMDLGYRVVKHGSDYMLVEMG